MYSLCPCMQINNGIFFIVVRSQRLSTDAASDSGSTTSSSGVSSDSNVEEGCLPDSTATTPVAMM